MVNYPPAWKIKREVWRLCRDIFNMPGLFFDRFLSTAYYDYFERKNVVRGDGVLPRGQKVALYLIFPKAGLLPSHKRSIEFIAKNGYAPFVISNLPLLEEDRDYLEQNTWKFLSRPNRGYDFGGYREGVMSIGPDVKSLEKLVFLNDSSWFPIPNTGNWFSEADALGADYVSVATSYGIKRVHPENYQDIVWKLDTSLRNFHYCSYAIMVGRRILRDPRYFRKWRRYVLSNNKRKVVRRGEMGMSRFAVDLGFTHSATYDIESLPEALDLCSDEELNHYLKSLILLNDQYSIKNIDEIRGNLDATKSIEDRKKVKLLLMIFAARIGVSYFLPEFLYRKHQFPFVKKSPTTMSQSDSDIMYRFATLIGGLDGEIIRDEMRALRKSKGFSNALDEGAELDSVIQKGGPNASIQEKI